MDSLSALLLVIVILCTLFLLLYKRRTNANLPPKPFGLPLIGHTLFIGPRLFIAHSRYKSYGPLCRLQVGMMPYVLLNSHQAITEAFLGQAAIFAGRPQWEYLNMISHNSGIAYKEGDLWREHRRLTLQLMKEFGSGRAAGEEIVRDECNYMKQELLKRVDTPMNPKPLLASAINNVISRLVFGQRCGSDDPEFERFTEYVQDMFKDDLFDILPLIVPWIMKIPLLVKLHACVSDYTRKMEWMHNYIRDKIQQHCDALQSMEQFPNEIGQASDICEAFLIEQRKHELANPNGHTFTEWQVLRNMFELFSAGTETTATSLAWVLLYLALNPDVQARVQREIEERVGRDRSPTMADRQQLPYVCAVLDEALRLSSPVPNCLEHKTLADTNVMGYNIPANTIIYANLYGVHHDPELWTKPEQFYPEHFLTADGEYRASKYLIPFSIGKRACLGESLAKMEYFLALVTMMQVFEVRLADSKQDIAELMLGTDGVVHAPCPYEIIFSKLDGSSN